MFKNSSLEKIVEQVNTAAKSGTCPRKRVGACLYIRETKENKIFLLSSGSNQSLPNMPSCDEVGCDLVASYNSANTFETPLKHNCVRTVHAEIKAMRELCDTETYFEYVSPDYYYNLVMISNTFPCWNCFKSMITNGIHEIYFFDSYNNDKRIDDYIRVTPIVSIFQIKTIDGVLKAERYLPKGEQ
jgi:deoxycytidylate deaminase